MVILLVIFVENPRWSLINNFVRPYLYNGIMILELKQVFPCVSEVSETLSKALSDPSDEVNLLC